MRVSKLKRARKAVARGFTLVELLVVIAIIGAIAAIAIPAIGRVINAANRASQKAELTSLESGIESYYTKYGDYPPDFSNWGIVKRHYLKIFPDIAQSELNLLFRLCDTITDTDGSQMASMPTNTSVFDPTAMDRAEAVVWSLGGFSSDPQYPFTGEGGPLSILNPSGSREDPANVEYNSNRVAPEISFEPNQLSLTTPNPAAARSYTNRFASKDDDGTNNPNDVFPVYRLKPGASPVVYFDSRTYAIDVTNGSGVYNGYARRTSDSATDYDGIRPVYSNNPGVVPPTGNDYATAGIDPLTGWEFVNPNTYQLLAPGLDGLYGDVFDDSPNDPPTPGSAPIYFKLDGTAVWPVATATAPAGLIRPDIQRFDVTGLVTRSLNPFRDNMGNVVDGTFEDILD
ncbi:type II secretion system protein [Roseiconus lacunae]|uniref:Prepilin-type N-terminal cleavage/methylation domain-containing protein n=1 Tax=Roseiconus lacunae TaxID=2605694 RepID=A0ABT7PJ73_9BACT|nr:prepilin-type N-terminal cleavage/methylation domain-containing protein [Roseiconus lacunae]MCD0461806.1 prepilin-type N-terminal cleavage/methylation domain-containing protein [Roseiconus lacunae]MDM4016551.1 prepilin-type N-terminal cleavage/methylation domain-containing protein [Roseiconus lacunae]WRQ49420.1 prepilin-type N-terminal cleavage/methylation domain-containing protein [Stieleria sp. HD01]